MVELFDDVEFPPTADGCCVFETSFEKNETNLLKKLVCSKFPFVTFGTVVTNKGHVAFVCVKFENGALFDKMTLALLFK